ncbi:MAG TPA: universal stress protein [Chryseolinea sp.]
MKKILCPTDFSDTARNAITYAAKLAHKLNAELTLFNVQSLGDLTLEEATWGEDVNVGVAAEQLESLCLEVSKVFKISCYPAMASSLMAVNSRIGDISVDYDLIIMGTDGPDDMFQFLLGSNTYQVIKKTSTAVLLIPRDCGYSDITSTVYAFDYQHHPTLPLAQLLPILKPLGSTLAVVAVTDGAHSEDTTLDVEIFSTRVAELHKDGIQAEFHILRSDDPVKRIDQFVTENKIDLLVLCSSHHNLMHRLFHKSVIRSVNAMAHYPVLVFHA